MASAHTQSQQSGPTPSAGGRFVAASVPGLRVVLADDDPLVRRELRTAMGNLRIDVVAEASDGAEAVDEVLRSRPDVVLMDADMPNVDGIIATLRIRRAMPAAKIVIMATTDDPELGVLALRAGATGFLAKDVTVDALGRALRGVLRGEAALSRGLTLSLVEQLRRVPQYAGGLRPVRSDLTTREWQVLDLLCHGSSTPGIAASLDLSIETVRSHIKHILGKLNVHTRAEAIAKAEELRDTPPADDRADGLRLDEAAFRKRLSDLRGERGT